MLLVEMEYLGHAPGGTLPMLFTGLVDPETCEARLDTAAGISITDWYEEIRKRDQEAEQAPPTGEHCVDYADRHLGFESLVRAAVERAIASEGGTDVGTGSLRDATIRPAREWHPYEAKYHVSYDDARGRFQFRDFFAKGAIHTETCEARLDSIR